MKTINIKPNEIGVIEKLDNLLLLKPIGLGSNEIQTLYMKARRFGGWYSQSWGGWIFYNKENAEKFNKIKS